MITLPKDLALLLHDRIKELYSNDVIKLGYSYNVIPRKESDQYKADVEFRNNGHDPLLAQFELKKVHNNLFWHMYKDWRD